ncbi:uncharacterized protein PHALS_12933 [Plasmopara halstedii]|uniref:Uncharacterized protein n=1 Tax=Plasmopara halstedii TaxID=4781 RepID=A0A0P1AN79_PLAHL|nr:uncharacterized protein PHALS_12933 [Plasmopara halstedii]CEG42679.1 hypothetical protein PHALS_12933 [Plasmopara halstedii]|eukprot:XP_024579048.1 hypothetical protein PHALS_12933 [Plasmopara halstedii]
MGIEHLKTRQKLVLISTGFTWRLVLADGTVEAAIAQKFSHHHCGTRLKHARKCKELHD